LERNSVLGFFDGKSSIGALHSAAFEIICRLISLVSLPISAIQESEAHQFLQMVRGSAQIPQFRLLTVYRL
jgi:hypothetical protein